MELLLIRHGQSRANIGQCNDCDCDLTPLGREQAIAIGRSLATRFDLSSFTGICSPYRRTRQTAELIKLETRLSFTVNAGCREWGSRCDVDGIVFPGETAGEVVTRLDAFRTSLDPNGQYVIVAHASPIFILMQLCLETAVDEVARLFVGDFWQVIENGKLTHVRHRELICLSQIF